MNNGAEYRTLFTEEKEDANHPFIHIIAFLFFASSIAHIYSRCHESTELFLQDAPGVVICDFANPYDMGICWHLSYTGQALGAIDA